MKKEPIKLDPGAFESRYPHIAWWVQDGTVEIGREPYTRTFLRAADEGGVIWEGEAHYATMDDALQALDDGIKAWMDENG